MSWIDVHTHLQMLDGSGAEAVKEARAQGVEYIINIGTSDKDWDDVAKWAEQKNIFGALGMHPHEAKDYTDQIEDKLKDTLKAGLKHKGIVAVGEIGLDYYYEHSDRNTQKKVFRRQMDIAKELGLPVEIHTRDAEADTLEILTEYKSSVRGLLHCFTSSMDMAKKALDIGYNISFSGIVTFKNAGDLREVCKFVPVDRLHVETDAPYLAPMPHRGKTNQPSYLIHTAKLVAGLKEKSSESLKTQLLSNAVSLFSLSL